MARTILLYEDNPSLSESIQSMLELNEQVRLTATFPHPGEIERHVHQYNLIW